MIGYIVRYAYWLVLSALLAVLSLLAPALAGALGVVLGQVPQPALIPVLVLFAAVHVAWKAYQKRNV